MTKEELKKKLEEAEEEIKQLENDVDYWIEQHNEIEEKCDDLECKIADLEMKGGINDLSNFIHRLKVDGLYCDKLQAFIDEYLRFYND